MEGEIRKVFGEAARLAAAGGPGYLAVVVRVRGSTPQRVGAKLCAREDGRFVGTVGGGAVEAAVLADGPRVREEGQPAVLNYRLSADLGMCCGGTMEVYAEPLSAEAAPLYLELARLAQDAEGGAFGIVIASDDPAWPLGAKMVATLSGVLAVGIGEGPLRQPLERDLRALCEGGDPHVAAYIMPGGHEVEVYLEPVEEMPRLVLFGAGHVSQPLARVAKLLGFRVLVVDDRVDWASRERFPDVDALIHEPCLDFLYRFDHRPTDYLLIITRGHELDQQVLEMLVDKEHKYLGMIGSRSKIKRAFLRLEAAGVLSQLLQRVRAPIGLNIGAQTPEEIAVAVGAELVLERRNASRKHTGTPPWWREEE